MLLPRGLGHDNVCGEELGWFLYCSCGFRQYDELPQDHGTEKEFIFHTFLLFLHCFATLGEMVGSLPIRFDQRLNHHHKEIWKG